MIRFHRDYDDRSDKSFSSNVFMISASYDVQFSSIKGF